MSAIGESKKHEPRTVRLSEGVEWAAHAAALLAVIPRDKALPGAKLAEYLGVAPAYLAKQMQALSRAGIVETERGPAGGYRLAKPPAEISLKDITLAIEGNEPAFRCQDIRVRGPVGVSAESCKRICGVARAFHDAERAYRDALANVPLTELVADGAKSYDSKRAKLFTDWLGENLR